MTKSDICHRQKGVTITANSNCIYWVKPNTVHIPGLIKTYQEWVYENQILYLLACMLLQHVQPCPTVPEDNGKISLKSVSGIWQKLLHFTVFSYFHIIQSFTFLGIFNSREEKKSTKRPFGFILEHGKKWGKQKSSDMIASLSSTQLGTCQNAGHTHYCCFDNLPIHRQW